MPAYIPRVNNHYINFILEIFWAFLYVIFLLIDGMPVFHLWKQKEVKNTEKQCNSLDILQKRSRLFFNLPGLLKGVDQGTYINSHK